MDADVVRQFIDFFQDFLKLNEAEDWPNDSTSEQEIRNFYSIAVHIEKCMDKFQQQGLLDDYLAATMTEQWLNKGKTTIKECFANPAKIVIKKLVKSKTNVKQVDIAFKLFIEFYCVEKLELVLKELFLEAASIHTLIKNIPSEFSNDELLEFNTNLFLSELSSCKDQKNCLNEIIKNLSMSRMELLIHSLLNTDIKHDTLREVIKNEFIETMISKKETDKEFWKFLFRVKDSELKQLCHKFSDLFRLMSAALFDLGKLLKENMSTDCFYINLNYSEMTFVVQKICEDKLLRLEFIDILRENGGDLEFWEPLVKET